jgi:hypothetical protein
MPANMRANWVTEDVFIWQVPLSFSEPVSRKTRECSRGHYPALLNMSIQTEKSPSLLEKSVSIRFQADFR